MSAEQTPPRSAPPHARAGRTVLVVDDDDETRRLIVRWLSRAGLSCLEAGSGEAALELAGARADAIDGIVLDVMMPGIDGFETMRRLKESAATAAIPVTLLTAHANDDVDIVRGVETGAVDHLAKPFSGPVLVAKVRALCDRGHEARELRQRLRYAEQNATVDPLTKLLNRRSFEARFHEEGAHAKRHSEPFALILIDLDHFKSINDTFGHEEGDRALVHVAAALRSALRKEDAAFRYGGEEFVVLVRATDGPGGLAVAERVRAALKEQPIALGPSGDPRTLTLSAGVAAADAANEYESAGLVARADEALYRAKAAGRDRCALAGE